MNYESLFYGDLSPQGYKISYILLDRHIQHNFVLIDTGFIFSIKTTRKLREFVGFEKIIRYLEEYGYLLDFPEVDKW